MEETTPKKRKRNPIENLRHINELPPEEQYEIRSRGGRNAAATMKRRRELLEMDMAARDMVRRYMTNWASDERKAALRELGFDEDELTNMNVFVHKLFEAACKGSVRAAELLMTIGRYSGEEQRKDHEEQRKDHEEQRKTRETDARIEALKAGIGSDMGVESGDDEGSVHIYLPPLRDIKEDEVNEADDE